MPSLAVIVAGATVAVLMKIPWRGGEATAQAVSDIVLSAGQAGVAIVGILAFLLCLFYIVHNTDKGEDTATNVEIDSFSYFQCLFFHRQWESLH